MTGVQTCALPISICVHPDDERYKHLVGKRAIVPISGRSVPIIADEYVEMDFGTGCLKVTPAHDVNDYELGKKHNLETIDIFTDGGILNEKGLHYEGMDRFEVRKKIAKELEEKGYLVKVEDHINKVGYSERTDCVIEPRLSLQWFVSMKELAEPALNAVMDGTIQFHPEKFKNTYRHWMENIKDWCISRQLWWGHQIPAWYFGSGSDDFVVCKTLEEAIILASDKTGRSISASDLKQDEDVLDTWFSSWLWPISVFKGLTDPNNKEINYYYPTNDLVTAPEIMFFWVARMVMAGYEYLGEAPFKNVYFTGIVRDKLGRKMSKSLGNSPDPLDLIEKYGADGVRLGILISSPAGNDLPFDTSQCEQGRNFSNKIWNAFRLVSAWEVRDIPQPDASKQGIVWFKNRFNEALVEINQSFDKFKISEALMASYKLIWDDFCSSYLEIIKPGYEQPIDKSTLDQTILFFEDVLRIIQPFTPFISEEIWHLLRSRAEGDDIVIAKWPELNAIDNDNLIQFEEAKEVITQIRNIRKKNNIATKVKMELFIKKNEAYNTNFDAVIVKLGNLSRMDNSNEKVSNAFSFLVKSNEYYVPFGEQVDAGAEKEKMQEEIVYLRGFLESVNLKLSNEKFVAGAPESVISAERKKASDAEAKIAILLEKLA